MKATSLIQDGKIDAKSQRDNNGNLLNPEFKYGVYLLTSKNDRIDFKPEKNKPAAVSTARIHVASKTGNTAIVFIRETGTVCGVIDDKHFGTGYKLEKENLKFSTVNLIQISKKNNMIDVDSVHSWKNTPTGCKKAESLFSDVVAKKYIEEHGTHISQGNLENIIENGYYENNDFYISITHSS